MAKEEIIARRYARGLAELARDTGEADAVRGDLGRVADLLNESVSGEAGAELLSFFDSPLPTADDKRAALDAIIEKTGVCGTVGNFLRILIERGRVGLLTRVSRTFDEIIGEITGDLTATVHTARPLTPDQESRLAEALKAALGANVRLHQRVEAGLLAGARVEVDGLTFDGTVLGRLDSLRHRMNASLERR